MGVVSELVKNVKIPEMVRVKQWFDDARIMDVPAKTNAELHQEKITSQIHPGMRIAIGAGSRGISNYAVIIKCIVDFVKEMGAEPFIVPAMGSHGGACADGQRQMLAGYGITEEEMGCPVRCSMETAVIGRTADDRYPVQIDKYAAEADGIIICNRIKAHTAFRGPYESGLMKMLAIGLAKQKGAEFCHSRGFKYMAEMVELFGKGIIANSKLLFGVALLENAYDKTADILALTPAEIISEEPKLQQRSKELMPRILIEHADLLIVDEIGKDVSGDGMDPNISGTFAVPYASGGIDVQRVAVLDITEKSHGNTIGWGMADTSTRRAFDKFDPEVTYPNSLTCRVTQVSKIPMIFRNDRECIQGAIKTMADVDYDDIKIVRIKNTLSMAEIEISANLLPLAEAHPNMEVCGECAPMAFDENGNLF